MQAAENRRVAQIDPLLTFYDVWRISEDLALDCTRRIAIANVVAVLQGYFEAGCEVGLLSWVFARPQLFEPVIAGIEDSVDSVHLVYLVASPEAIGRRLNMRQESHRLEYSLSRLELIHDSPHPKIDTTDLSPADVVNEVIAHVRSL